MRVIPEELKRKPREKLAMREKARENFVDYAQAIEPTLTLTPFHASYYSVLDAFAKGKIRRLIITVPPQHGKSLGSTILLPSYILGLNPNIRIAIASYSGSLASKFSRRIQQRMDSSVYRGIFPNTALPTRKDIGSVRTANEFDIVNSSGSLIAVGREGALTGNTVDCFIIDDLYKDSMEANSPTVRESAIEWYSSVVRTRQHNNAQELIVFTRWHEEDLIGWLIGKKGVIPIKSLDDIDPKYRGHYLLNYQAIKEDEPTELDNRQVGELLWEERHGLERLESEREDNAHVFQCLYQGDPQSASGLLYGSFSTYELLPSNIIKVANYTDTADMGNDYLCSVCYVVGDDGKIYVTDVVYTAEPMEVTEPLVADMLESNEVRIAYIESNNGGRGFARSVQRLAPRCKVEWFHQSTSKEARILTNSASVVENIIMPEGWQAMWSKFAYSLLTYKREFKANRTDDAPDVLTGIIEREIYTSQRSGRVKFVPKRW